MRYLIKIIENMYDDGEDENHYDNLPSSDIISSVKPKIILVAQKIYDLWIQNENDELNGGGICHLIADKIADILSDIGIPSVTVSSNYEQHVYTVSQCSNGIFEIDIPYSIYEVGGGFTWTKIENVCFTVDDVLVSKLDGDPGNMKNYVDEWEE